MKLRRRKPTPTDRLASALFGHPPTPPFAPNPHHEKPRFAFHGRTPDGQAYEWQPLNIAALDMAYNERFNSPYYTGGTCIIIHTATFWKEPDPC